MNTTHKKILSPLQPKMKPARNVIDVRDEKHPAHEEIRRLCGNAYNINVSFEEDKQTLGSFPHIPGLIAIRCILKRDGQIIAFGRGCGIFSRLNKYLERTISTAINGSFLSAANNATKVFEALRISEEGTEDKFEEISRPIQYQDFESASEKQKSYLRQLVTINVTDEDERNEITSRIDELNKDEASEMIGNFLASSK
jgi:hypothetical protein